MALFGKLINGLNDKVAEVRNVTHPKGLPRWYVNYRFGRKVHKKVLVIQALTYAEAWIVLQAVFQNNGGFWGSRVVSTFRHTGRSGYKARRHQRLLPTSTCCTTYSQIASCSISKQPHY
jgi:hypothetical protein